jgi:hypothetical protein
MIKSCNSAKPLKRVSVKVELDLSYTSRRKGSSKAGRISSKYKIKLRIAV